MLKALMNALRNIGNFLYATACIPFDIIFGGLGSRRAAPEYKPQESAVSLADRLSPERKRETELTRDRKDIVLGYCNAHPSNRDTYDLTGLKPEVQNILLGMNDAQLAHLASSSLFTVIKFAEGDDHKMFGVPVIRRDIEMQNTAESLQSRIRRLVPSRPVNEYNVFAPRRM